ncbi:MAG: ShlB/FhaC/HecB family hemolysin secretion/activation protein [Deltaproteobacteria bacterium]|nr:ShlB/FhaC/HecB family hemolysin secretion/activation protein [Deltaproteobacteria bacterium]
MRFFTAILAALVFGVLWSPALASDQVEIDPSFEIKGFRVEGNTLLAAETLEEVLRPFTGPAKTFQDVEAGRTALEKYYQENGYVRVLVNIPRQTVEEGTISLDVIETKVARVKVVGNRYFTRASILDKLAALESGEILYAPDVEEQFRDINGGTDLKVKLNLVPGRQLGEDIVELTVEDRLPLHASVELNNRSGHDTADLRLNGLIRYDNLWQWGHSISFQYQTSPEDTSEVQVVGGSYVLPTPWCPQHFLAFFALWTDSETAFGEGFSQVGSGTFLGARYLINLPPYQKYFHSVSLGLDYKDMDETTSMAGAESERDEAPITYMPFSIGYNSSLFDATGVTKLSAGVNMAFRGAVTDQEEFEYKRYQARGSYIYLTLGLEREQKLPWGMQFDAALDGQISSQALVSSEQFSAGGMESVRGYMESEAMGDHGIHGTFELAAPDLGEKLGWQKYFRLTPYLFYDFACLEVKDPLPEQDAHMTLQGTGFGIRGGLIRGLSYQMDVAWALTETERDTERIDEGDSRIHFFVKYQF